MRDRNEPFGKVPKTDFRNNFTGGYFSMISIRGSKGNHPSEPSGKSKKTWRLFL